MNIIYYLYAIYIHIEISAFKLNILFYFNFFFQAIQAALAVAFSHERTSENKTSLVPEALAEEMEDAGLGIEWNMYTATGWVATFLGALNFFLFMPCIFKVSRQG